jgi:hypothetical protein
MFISCPTLKWKNKYDDFVNPIINIDSINYILTENYIDLNNQNVYSIEFFNEPIAYNHNPLVEWKFNSKDICNKTFECIKNNDFEKLKTIKDKHEI